MGGSIEQFEGRLAAEALAEALAGDPTLCGLFEEMRLRVLDQPVIGLASVTALAPPGPRA